MQGKKRSEIDSNLQQGLLKPLAMYIDHAEGIVFSQEKSYSVINKLQNYTNLHTQNSCLLYFKAYKTQLGI